MSDPAPDRVAALEQLVRPRSRRRALFRAGGWGSAPKRSLGVAADPGAGDLRTAQPVVRRRRDPEPFDPAPRLGESVERLRAALWERPGAVFAGVGVAVLAVAVLALWPLLRRPAPADESLPRAGSDPVTDVAPTSVAPPATAEPVAASGAPAAAEGAAAGPVTVHVAGAVAAPGVVTLPAGSRVVDAVGAAGGLRPDADSDRVNLAAPLGDGQRVVVPVVGQPAPEELATPAASGAGGVSGSGSPAGPAGPVDLNRATASELDELPGVGPATAAAIIDHRTRSGPFRSVDDLIEVRGIGEAKLEALRDLVVAG